jgi:hypothetical protein
MATVGEQGKEGNGRRNFVQRIRETPWELKIESRNYY